LNFGYFSENNRVFSSRLLNFAPAAPCFQTTNLRYRS
jgi:hypothetical protein